MFNKKVYCLLSSFFSILNRVLSNLCLLNWKSYLHFRRSSTKLYCSVSSFHAILNRVLSKKSNTRITVFSFTRSENAHIFCYVCILSSVEPKKVNYVKNLKIVSAFSYVKQKVLLFAFNLLCYIESCIIKNIKYANNCF